MRLLGMGNPDRQDPFTPDDEDDRQHPQSAQSVDSSLLSSVLVPKAIRRRAISLSISTPRTEYPLDASVPFSVTMKNALPLPVTLTTRSPVLWTWTVDGLVEASHVERYDPPDEPGKLHFQRGERKQFTDRWRQLFRVSKREWEPAGPGEYTLGASVNVDGPAGERLADEVTITLVEE